MTEYEKLIEMICEGLAQNCGGDCTLPTKIYCQNCHIIADYLLKNNIVALPCKVGDTVYQYGKRYTKCTPYGYIPKCLYDSMCIGCCSECDSKPYDFLHEGTVVDFSYNGKDIKVGVNWKNKFDTSSYVIGKDVFLSKEEAEKSKQK